jgi:arylsulfatase A-like enzyme
MMTRFAKGTQPWHLEVHFVEPHDPYLPLKQYLDRYDPRSIPVPKSFADTFAGKPGLHRRESETWGAVTADDVRQSRAHYYAYTEQLDAQIGRILKTSMRRGRRIAPWWRSPWTMAIWSVRTACGSRAGFPTKSAIACR